MEHYKNLDFTNFLENLKQKSVTKLQPQNKQPEDRYTTKKRRKELIIRNLKNNVRFKAFYKNKQNKIISVLKLLTNLNLLNDANITNNKIIELLAKEDIKLSIRTLELILAFLRKEGFIEYTAYKHYFDREKRGFYTKRSIGLVGEEFIRNYKLINYDIFPERYIQPLKNLETYFHRRLKKIIVYKDIEKYFFELREFEKLGFEPFKVVKYTMKNKFDKLYPPSEKIKLASQLKFASQLKLGEDFYSITTLNIIGREPIYVYKKIKKEDYIKNIKKKNKMKKGVVKMAEVVKNSYSSYETSDSYYKSSDIKIVNSNLDIVRENLEILKENIAILKGESIDRSYESIDRSNESIDRSNESIDRSNESIDRSNESIDRSYETYNSDKNIREKMMQESAIQQSSKIKYKDLDENIKQALIERYNEHVYNAWFDQLKVVNFDTQEKKLTLYCKLGFVRDYILKNYWKTVYKGDSVFRQGGADIIKNFYGEVQEIYFIR